MKKNETPQERIVRKLNKISGCAFALLFFVPIEMYAASGGVGDTYPLIAFFFLATFGGLFYLAGMHHPTMVVGKLFDKINDYLIYGRVLYFSYFVIWILALVFFLLRKKKSTYAAVSTILSLSFATLMLPWEFYFLSLGVEYWTLKMGFFVILMYLIAYAVILPFAIVRLVRFFRIRKELTGERGVKVIESIYGVPKRKKDETIQERIVRKLNRIAGCAFTLLFFVQIEMCAPITSPEVVGDAYPTIASFFFATFGGFIYLFWGLYPTMVCGKPFVGINDFLIYGRILYFSYFVIWTLALVFFQLRKKNPTYAVASTILSLGFATLMLPWEIYFLSLGVTYWSLNLGYFILWIYLVAYAVILSFAVVRLFNFFRMKREEKRLLQKTA
ncbi:MAG: hypothetical protein J6D37_04775 [Clostridia bacterium]|nr:hypothetical protein [Clostridia bacterium]